MAVSLQSAFDGKRTLITGGLGFIGSNLAHRLAALGGRVLIVDSLDPNYGGNRFNLLGIEETVQVRIADLRDNALASEVIHGQDYIFNLAGQVSHLGSMKHPVADLQINAGAQLAIVEACRQVNPGIKIVYAGTRQIYGRPRYLPVDESHPVEPIDYNGVTKRAGELYHLVAHRVYGLRAVSLRMTNVYGPRMRVRDNRQSFIGWWIRLLTEGQPIPIYGNGQQIRDFNFVDDVVDALLLAAANPAADGQIYNLGSDEPLNLLALARMMIEINGRGGYELVPFPKNRKRIDIGDYHGDYTKIRTQLGWQPATSLRDGLTRTLAYYAKHHAYYW